MNKPVIETFLIALAATLIGNFVLYRIAKSEVENSPNYLRAQRVVAALGQTVGVRT